MALQDLLYAPDVITRYNNLEPSRLTHLYVPERLDNEGNLIDFDRVIKLLASLRSDIAQDYECKTGQPFDTYRLGDSLSAVQEQFWQDERFAEAFSLLGLDVMHQKKAALPWWNELAAGELEHMFKADGTPHIVLGPRHSLETQLMRAGVSRPVRNVSVGGIITAVPDEQSAEGYVLIGLRGGASFPNTYHINAGALSVTDEFKRGTATIYDIFREKELIKEFGVHTQDIRSANVLSRIVDDLIDQGPTYVFLIETGLTQVQLYEQWQSNLDPDKKEHDVPIFIPVREVDRFIDASYRGHVENRQMRADSERYLLHPGALALASFTGRPAASLAQLYQPGTR